MRWWSLSEVRKRSLVSRIVIPGTVDRHGADRLAKRIAQKNEARGETTDLAILAEDRNVRRRAIQAAFAMGHGGMEPGPVPGSVLFRDDQIQAMADRILCAIAEEHGSPQAPHLNGSGLIRNDNGVRIHGSGAGWIPPLDGPAGSHAVLHGNAVLTDSSVRLRYGRSNLNRAHARGASRPAVDDWRLYEPL